MTNEIFDEPSISRQWVLRRLQQALTLDLAAGALLDGLGRTCRANDRGQIRELAADAADRAARVRQLIEDEGGTPYSSVGLARGCSRLGGILAGPLKFAWKPGLRLLAEHTMQEYDALVAQLRTAPGITPGLDGRAQPLFESAERAHSVLRSR